MFDPFVFQVHEAVRGQEPITRLGCLGVDQLFEYSGVLAVGQAKTSVIPKDLSKEFILAEK